MEKSNKNYVQMFENARTNILLFAVLTLVNAVLLIFKLDFSFSFAGIFPVIAIAYGQTFYTMTGKVIIPILGYALAALFILLLVMVYFSTKKHRKFIYVALGILIFDLIALGYWIYLGFMLTDIIDILFHIWFGFYVVMGIHALKKIEGDNSGELPEESEQDAEKEELPEMKEEEPLGEETEEVSAEDTQEISEEVSEVIEETETAEEISENSVEE